MKKCSKCNTLKEESEFSKDKHKKDWLTCQCKLCRNTFKQERIKTDWQFRQKEKNYRILRKANKKIAEKDKEVHKLRRQENKRLDYYKERYPKIKDKKNEKRRTFEIWEFVLLNWVKYQIHNIKKYKWLFLVWNKNKFWVAKYKVKRFIPKIFNF